LTFSKQQNRFVAKKGTVDKTKQNEMKKQTK
jgi:hypothetical protein